MQSGKGMLALMVAFHQQVHELLWCFVNCSPIGDHFAVSNKMGRMTIFGTGNKPSAIKRVKQLTEDRPAPKKVKFIQPYPEEQFFTTDYAPLVRDANGWVLDEMHQLPPHLLDSITTLFLVLWFVCPFCAHFWYNTVPTLLCSSM